MNTTIGRTFLGGITALLATGALAQPFSIDWFTIGGGGTSSGGDFSISATVGEASSGHSAGGPFAWDGGFWSPTPGSPENLVSLSVFLTATNTVVVAWPSPSTGWSLQQSRDLGAPDWSLVPATPTDDGTHRYLVLAPSAVSRFYRLVKP